ncbi:MAG: glycosyltransferase, partial [bacterium]|nr:glycosyltransferase [bacterium]
RIKKQFPDLAYVIVGNQRGRYFHEMQKNIIDLGIADDVRFYQDLTDEDLLALYDHAVCFLLTPARMDMYVEGFGLVYREAGARKLAVIGSKDCGAEDAVQDGVTGILCPQNDISAVADALHRLLEDAALRKRMGEAGRKLAQSWTWSNVAEQYKAIYAEVLYLNTHKHGMA